MAYFPEQIMPSVVKQNVRNPSGDVLADDLNSMTEEVISIEQFLGTGPAASDDENAVASRSAAPQNILGVVLRMFDSLNALADNGIGSSSGYLHNEQTMIFPENAHAAFLTAPVSNVGTTISVTSTVGFPDSGVLSILNDSTPVDFAALRTATSFAPESPVEWIKYSSKTDTAFLNCQRGYLGSVIGNHAGVLGDEYIPENSSPSVTAFTTNFAVADTTSGLNALSKCSLVRADQTRQYCNRIYPGFKGKTSYGFAAFGLVGSLLDIIRSIRRNPESFDLSPEALGSQFDAIKEAADDLGIFAVREDGKFILQSASPSFQALDQLQWSEASQFVSALQTASVVNKLKSPGDWAIGIVGNAPVGGGGGPIPVFQGMMSVNYSVAAMTANAATDVSFDFFGKQSAGPLYVTEPLAIHGMAVLQSADGRLMIYAMTNAYDSNTAIFGRTTTPFTRALLDQAIIQYQTFFVPCSQPASDRRDF